MWKRETQEGSLDPFPTPSRPPHGPFTTLHLSTLRGMVGGAAAGDGRLSLPSLPSPLPSRRPQSPRVVGKNRKCEESFEITRITRVKQAVGECENGRLYAFRAAILSRTFVTEKSDADFACRDEYFSRRFLGRQSCARETNLATRDCMSVWVTKLDAVPEV